MTKLDQSNFDNYFMLEAIKEAEKAYAKGEVPVGCVIVHRATRKIIAKTRNIMQQKQNPNLHAEILAINIACEQTASKCLIGYDIYVTLEPCTMCASAISNARLSRIYYGAQDSKQGAIENGVRFFTSNACFHRPEIYEGIEKDRAETILKDFFIQLRNNQ